MSKTTNNGVTLNSPYTAYSDNNNFTLPIFIDPSITPSATIHFNAPDKPKGNIHGHLVIPIFQEGALQNYFSSIDATGNRILPLN